MAAGIASIDQPARSSSIARLVPPERLPAAIALNQLNFQSASVIGPAIGGVLIATVGLPGAYLVDVLSFVASLVGDLGDRTAAARSAWSPGRGSPRSARGSASRVAAG